MKLADIATFDRLDRGKNIRDMFIYDDDESFRDMVFFSVMDNINSKPRMSKRLDSEYTYIPF